MAIDAGKQVRKLADDRARIGFWMKKPMNRVL